MARTAAPKYQLNILNAGELKQAVTSDPRVVESIANLLNGRHGTKVIECAMAESDELYRRCELAKKSFAEYIDGSAGQDQYMKTPAQSPVTAPQILTAGAEHIAARAASRDCLDGERSMARTVKAFNAMFGTHLTEVQGWQFMVVLKMARASAGGHNPDDYEDGAAYFALAGEAADADNREFEKHFGPHKSDV